MLVKFEVENFKNFEGHYTFDLSKPNSYGFNTEAVSERDNCISKAIIYGPNGSGKSNLGLAIMDITTVLTSSNIELRKYRNYINLLHPDIPASFRYTFRFGGHSLIYEYKKKTLQELLYEKVTIDGRPVIEFDYRDMKGETTLRGAETLNLLADAGNQNQPKVSRVRFLLASAVLEDDEVNHVFREFGDFVNKMLLFYCLEDRGYQGFTNSQENIGVAIVAAGHMKDFEEFLRENGIDYHFRAVDAGNGETIYCDINGKLVDFFQIASTGTNSLALFYYWYMQMKKMSFVFIDEFDAFYHFELAQSLVRLLRKLENTQIILTTHNTDLMSNDLLRPDCYFIIENNKIVTLAEATDKELRQAHNLQKMYKAGAFTL